MCNITIRMPAELTARVARAAESAGLTQLAFIEQAIESQVVDFEARTGLHELAQSRWDDFERCGELVSADAMRRYVHALKAGKKPALPRARKVPF